MTLPSSGTINHKMIQDEFGGSNPISMTEYYGAATGIPGSGTIKLSDFYGTSSSTDIVATILLVAGGGAGGIGTAWAAGGGGSGGEVIEVDYTFKTGVNYRFEIGGGGVSGINTSVDGGDTVLKNVDTGEVIYRVKGGSGGGFYTENGPGTVFKNSTRGSGACSKSGYNTGSALNVRRFSGINGGGRENGDSILTTTSPIYGGDGVPDAWYSAGGGAGWGQPSSDGSDNTFAKENAQSAVPRGGNGQIYTYGAAGNGGGGFITYITSAFVAQKNSASPTVDRPMVFGCGGGGGTYREEKSDVSFIIVNGGQGGLYYGGRGGKYRDQDNALNPTSKQIGLPGEGQTGSGGGGGGTSVDSSGSFTAQGGDGGSGVAYIRFPKEYSDFMPFYIYLNEDNDDNYIYLKFPVNQTFIFEEGNYNWPEPPGWRYGQKYSALPLAQLPLDQLPLDQNS